MGKKTTLKTASLGYRQVGGSGDYTMVMGVLKGLTITQDTPDATEIEAEFYDTPFDISYDGNPPVIEFQLVNFDLAELPALFGGTYDPATDTYDAAPNAYTSEWEWKLEFQKGNKAFIVNRGVTLGVIGKDEDGALTFRVTVTGLTYTDGNEEDHVYKIAGGTQVTFTAVSTSISGYNSKNPKTEGWYEKDGSSDVYRLTWDTTVVDGKTYYTKS